MSGLVDTRIIVVGRSPWGDVTGQELVNAFKSLRDLPLFDHHSVLNTDNIYLLEVMLSQKTARGLAIPPINLVAAMMGFGFTNQIHTDVPYRFVGLAYSLTVYGKDVEAIDYEVYNLLSPVVGKILSWIDEKHYRRP